MCCWEISEFSSKSASLSSLKGRNAIGESKFVYFPDIPSSAEHEWSVCYGPGLLLGQKGGNWRYRQKDALT